MYREVRMVEITEVVRLWRGGVPKKRIAARLGQSGISAAGHQRRRGHGFARR
jgi:hypothetical protein